MPFDPAIFDETVFDTSTYVPVPDPPPIDLNQPVSLLTSLGGVMQINLAPATVTQLRSKGWATDVTQITFQQAGLPLISYPANAIKLKNEMLDFIFGYSTPRVSPYNTAPYTGYIAAPATADGILPPAGYLITGYKTGTIGTSDFIAWLVVKNDASGFLLYDAAKEGYLPYSLGTYGLPALHDDEYVNPYFSPIGRSTTDLFPPTLSDGVSPTKRYTQISNVPDGGPFQVVIPTYPYFQSDRATTYFLNILVTDYYGVPWTEVFTGTPGPQQYKVTMGTGASAGAATYLFNSSDHGKTVFVEYEYETAFAVILAGAVVPVDPEDPAIDETVTGAPPTTSPFLWTYVDASPNTVSSALADALTVDLPIVDAGTGYDLNQIFTIAGGTGGQGYVSEVSSGVPTACKMWNPGSGYTNGTKATTATGFRALGGATVAANAAAGLTVSVTIIGASRDKPVSLINPDGPKVWDLVTGVRKTSLSMTHAVSGKSYLVAAANENANPATGPLNLTFPLKNVDSDNPTLAAAIRAIGIDPTSTTQPGGNGFPAFGYSVEDNSWNLLILNPSSVGGCQQLSLPSRCVYNPFTFGGSQFWNNCYECEFQWSVSRVYSPTNGDAGAGQTGESSTARDGNVCESVSELADAMLAAGADEDELPAFANLLAATVDDNFRFSIVITAPYVPTYMDYALMWQAILQGGMDNLVTMIPFTREAAKVIFNLQTVALLNEASTISMFSTAFDVDNGVGATYASGFSGSLGDGQLVTLGTIPSTTVRLRKFSGTPSTANGFVNVAAGVIPLITSSNNPLGRCSYNILSVLWKYALPLLTNVWWFYGNPPDFSRVPIPVYVPNATPTVAPGPPPTEKFGTCNVCSDTLDTRDLIQAHP